MARWRVGLGTRALCLGLAVPALAGCGASQQVRAADAAPKAPRIETVRVPEGGYQVQAATDPRGVIHLVFLKGDARSADLLYMRRDAGKWSAPLLVGKPGAAVGAGTIRGPQLALGRNGRVHIVWFGSEKSGIKGNEGAPLLYSRSNPAGTGFEPPRNLMQVSTTLDGGPGVAADAAGNVYVGWQAAASKGEGELARRLWMARSNDDGTTFGKEAPAWNEPTGACPCCSTEVFADRTGRVFAMYRIAASRTERDMALVTSANQGQSFQGTRIDPWPVPT